MFDILNLSYTKRKACPQAVSINAYPERWYDKDCLSLRDKQMYQSFSCMRTGIKSLWIDFMKNKVGGKPPLLVRTDETWLACNSSSECQPQHCYWSHRPFPAIETSCAGRLSFFIGGRRFGLRGSSQIARIRLGLRLRLLLATTTAFIGFH
jgi:hypothetical protein